MAKKKSQDGDNPEYEDPDTSEDYAEGPYLEQTQKEERRSQKEQVEAAQKEYEEKMEEGKEEREKSKREPPPEAASHEGLGQYRTTKDCNIAGRDYAAGEPINVTHEDYSTLRKSEVYLVPIEETPEERKYREAVEGGGR